jgi:hypothetical protein
MARLFFGIVLGAAMGWLASAVAAGITDGMPRTALRSALLVECLPGQPDAGRAYVRAMAADGMKLQCYPARGSDGGWP